MYKPNAIIGRQNFKIENASIWLLPSTSGLNANHTPFALSNLFKELRLSLF